MHLIEGASEGEYLTNRASWGLSRYGNVLRERGQWNSLTVHPGRRTRLKPCAALYLRRSVRTNVWRTLACRHALNSVQYRVYLSPSVINLRDHARSCTNATQDYG